MTTNEDLLIRLTSLFGYFNTVWTDLERIEIVNSYPLTKDSYPLYFDIKIHTTRRTSLRAEYAYSGTLVPINESSLMFFESCGYLITPLASSVVKLKRIRHG